MKKILLAAALISIFNFQFSISQAQNNPVVIEIGGRQIRQQEFMKDFMQSVGNGLVAKEATESEKRKALDEYVELYANFQAKLRDAVSRGFDTSADLRNELARYRKDLASPYLIDSAMLKKIMTEAYERNRYALHAAHILVKVGEDASPEDTLAAYNRAMELYDQAMAGENFSNLIIAEIFRQNPEAKVQPNEGDLNFFTSFDMVYPFENAAYALEPGEISKPVRTRYGYHIIKLYEKVEFYGKVTLQHYWNRNRNAENEVLQAYERLQGGTPFEMIARQSDDASTANSGGYIYDASMQQLPQEYVTVLSLVKKETMPPFEKMESFYRLRMTRDPRGEASRKSFAAAARKKYGVVDLTTTPVPTKKTKKKSKKQQEVKMMATLDELVANLNTDVFTARWNVKDSAFHDLRPMVKVPGKEYNIRDVAAFIRHTQRAEGRTSLKSYARRHYDEFLDSVSIAYADSQLEKEHPDFADLVEEYRRGLMIFNYNEQMIWVKAIKDSVGFADYYARESAKKSLDKAEDSIYFWRTRARVAYFDVADSRCLDSEKAIKILRKAIDKNLSSSDMQDALLKKVNRKKCEVENPVTSGVELVEQTRHDLGLDQPFLVQYVNWAGGVLHGDMGMSYSAKKPSM